MKQHSSLRKKKLAPNIGLESLFLMAEIFCKITHYEMFAAQYNFQHQKYIFHLKVHAKDTKKLKK
jgi:hypothetical protein